MWERKRTIAIHKKAKLLRIKQPEHKPMETYSDTNNIQRITLKHLWSPNIGVAMMILQNAWTPSYGSQAHILLLLLTMLLMFLCIHFTTSRLENVMSGWYTCITWFLRRANATCISSSHDEELYIRYIPASNVYHFSHHFYISRSPLLLNSLRPYDVWMRQ